MVHLEEALKAYLTADPGVASLVEDRVYSFRLPEHCGIPAIAYHRVDAQRIDTFDSFDEYQAFVQVRVQFDCWAHDPMTVMDLGEALLAALSGYGGDMNGVLIQSHAINEVDTYESATKKYRRILDFRIGYEDPAKV